MFRIGRIATADLLAIAHASDDADVTYAPVGVTLTGEVPNGYRHDHYETTLPDRRDAFDLGVLALRQWVAHRGAGLSVAPDGPPAEGVTVAVAAPIGPMTAIAICRIVAVIDEPARYGFVYGTLPGHPERGEEAFLVERAGNRARFTVTAVSRPAERAAQLGGPITRAIQKRTTGRYLDAVVAFVGAGGS